MLKRKIILPIPGAPVSTEVQEYGDSDLDYFRDIYNKWVSLNTEIYGLGGTRKLNLPEILSEGLFCLKMNAVRTPKTGSYDCYDLTNNLRIQVKASSTKSDLTSFGPNSEWDELYFMDFYNNGNFDGTVKIYKLPSNIDNILVAGGVTFQKRKAEGKRPRFSIIKQIIIPKNLTPVKTFKL